MTWKSALNSSSRELWRETAGERRKRPFVGRAECGACSGKARKHWAFERPRLGAEKVVAGGNGGGKGAGIQPSPRSGAGYCVGHILCTGTPLPRYADLA